MEARAQVRLPDPPGDEHVPFLSCSVCGVRHTDAAFTTSDRDAVRASLFHFAVCLYCKHEQTAEREPREGRPRGRDNGPPAPGAERAGAPGARPAPATGPMVQPDSSPGSAVAHHWHISPAIPISPEHHTLDYGLTAEA